MNQWPGHGGCGQRLCCRAEHSYLRHGLPVHARAMRRGLFLGLDHHDHGPTAMSEDARRRKK